MEVICVCLHPPASRSHLPFPSLRLFNYFRLVVRRPSVPIPPISLSSFDIIQVLLPCTHPLSTPRPPTPPRAIFCTHVTFFFSFHPPPTAEPKLAARNPSLFCPHLPVFPSHDLSYIQDFSPAMFVHVRRCGYIKHAISPTAVPTLAVCAPSCFMAF